MLSPGYHCWLVCPIFGGSFFRGSPVLSRGYQWCVQEEEPQQLLFEGHKVATAHLVRMLMRIFVDIEFTGDSMEFEAKFRESHTVALSTNIPSRVKREVYGAELLKN